MTRKPKVQRKRVKALTDPQPEFVSLVTAGANMTPFRALKADGVEDAPAGEPAAEPAADPVVTDEVVAKADSHDITKIVFQKAAFADLAAVRQWLADGNYANIGDIVESEDAFTVGEDVETATKVEYTGVTVYVVEREEPAQASAASDGLSAEASPTAVTDVQPVAPAVRADDAAPKRVAKSLYTVPVLIDLVSALKWIVDDLSMEAAEGVVEGEASDYEAVIGALKQSANTMLTGLSDLFGIEVGELSDAFKAAVKTEASDSAASTTESNAPADGAVTTDTIVAEAKTDEAVAVEPAADAAAPAVIDEVSAAAASDAPAVSAEVLALTATVAKLAESVQQLTDGFRDLHNQVTAKSDDLAGRVSAIESERQSRKGADEDELQAGSASVAKHKSTGLADLSMRAALGIRRRGA